MGRKKIAMEKIENDTKRQVTFSKRHKGVIKKARELGTLTGCEILLIIFSGTGKLSEYTTTSAAYIMEKYRKATKRNELLESQRSNDELAMQQNQIKDLELIIRRLLGEELEYLNLEELRDLEQKLEGAISRIKAKKDGWVAAKFKERDELMKKFFAHISKGTPLPLEQLHQGTAMSSEVSEEKPHNLCTGAS